MLPKWCLPTTTNSHRRPSNPPIAIIGGGLAGLACSVDLTRQKKTHKIYESAAYYPQEGAGVALNPAAMAALEQIEPRLRRSVDSCALRDWDAGKAEWSKESTSWLTFRHGMETAPKLAVNIVDDITPVFGSVIADVQACGPTEVGRRCVHRFSLVEKMVGHIPAGITEFGKHLVDLEDDGTAVKLTFGDGTVTWASAVLACDGVRSVVRRAVLRSDPASIEPVFAGEYCYRNLIPMSRAQRILGDEMARKGSIFCGHEGYVTIYPVKWQRHEFVNMTAVRRQRGSTWPDTEAWRQPCTIQSVIEDFKGWGNPVIELLKTIHKPEKWALFDSPAAKTYFRGLVCLLGDAAHASTPHQGSGAAMAFEDACVMGHLLQNAQDPRGIVQAFHVFNKMRRARTQRLVFTSRAAGQVFEFAHEGILDNIDSVRENLMVRHSWIWNFDIRRELKKADREHKALSVARALQPSLWPYQWVEVTTSKERIERPDFGPMAHPGRRGTCLVVEEMDEDDEEYVGIDMDEDLQFEKVARWHITSHRQVSLADPSDQV
jgi:salicylate hydroxylase